MSFADIAQILTDTSGTPVPFVSRSDQDYLAHLMAAGLPEAAAGFALAWAHGVTTGEWDGNSGDLEKLLGRKPKTAAEYLQANYVGLKT